MNNLEDINISKALINAISDLGFTSLTPIQKKAFPIIRSGKNIVGISQTGTGKTLAYMLPILQDLKFSKQLTPRILIMVPTRELVLQLTEQTKTYAKYMSLRVLGVYGGTNINTQKKAVLKGADILISTPGRLYDLAVSGVLRLKSISKLVIDEVDVMLDLGFRYQLKNIFELLPKRRQNIMFSATMTLEVDTLINDYFIAPAKISVAVSGTRLENIEQQCFKAPNFYTKINLLSYLIENKEEYKKVLVFTYSKKSADKIFETLEETFGIEMGVIHSNKSQNYRIRTIKQFNEGKNRILITTDIMARGLDLENISHVVNIDTPNFPENYMHRIGRTGRAEKQGKSILFFTEKEQKAKEAIEKLMSYKIPEVDFPKEVKISKDLTPEEQPSVKGKIIKHRIPDKDVKGPAFHEKKDKNKKTNQGGSYLRKMKKYKRPKTKGDKNFNRRNKKK
ncbi:MAG: DEAD/DEAH box helicase [Bacteroidales bacterium]|nr:DEAD/DEAH box helicase [Bacteroidales bacterium]